MNSDINNIQSSSSFATTNTSSTDDTQQSAQTRALKDSDDISKSSTSKKSQTLTTPTLKAPSSNSSGGSGGGSSSSSSTSSQTAASPSQVGEIEATAFNTLETMILQQFLDESITQTDAKQMAQQTVQQAINQQLQSHGPIADSNFAQAMASMGEQILRSMSGKKGVDELTNTVNKLKAKATTETNPEFDILQELLKNENTKNMTNKEATNKALKDALDMSKGNDQFEDEALIGTQAQTTKAITDSIAKQLGNDEVAQGVATGVAEAMKIAQSALNFLQGANKVEATPEIDEVNRKNAHKVLSGVVNTLSDLVTETKAGIIATAPPPRPDFPDGTPGNKSTIAMLNLVAEIIGQFQQLLGSLVVSDNANASALSNEQIQQAQEQMKVQSEQLEKQMTESPWQKIINIVVTVVTTALALLAAPFTAGASLVALAWSLAITTITTVTSAVLTSTGVLTKAFTDLTTAITSALSKTKMPKWAQDVVTALVMVTIVIAAALVARGAAGQVTSSLVSAAIKSAAVQCVCVLASTSGLFTDIANVACDATDADQKTREIVEIVVNVVGSLALAGYAMNAAASIAQDLADSGSEIGDIGEDEKSAVLQKVQEFQDAASGYLAKAQLGSLALQTGNSIYQGVATVQQADAQFDVQQLGAEIQVISTLITLLQQSIKDLLGQSGSQGLMSLQVDLYNLFSNMVQSQQQAMYNLGSSLKSNA